MKDSKFLIRPLVRKLHPYVYGEQPKPRLPAVGGGIKFAM
jgi:hypothetical protein